MANTIEIQKETFDFTGNHLCLDFSNTLKDRATIPHEMLTNYTDFVRWGHEAGILSESEAERLRAEATQLPEEAEQVLRQAIELREAIYHIFYAQLYYNTAEEHDLAILNTWLARGMARACIFRTGTGFTWDWKPDEQALERVLWSVARSMAELLTGPELASVKICAAEDCRWLFLDTSKNHTRRWCDMKSCGNRAKVRKHYKKGQSGE